MITYNNKSQSVTEWAREMNINVDTLRHRIYDLNWSIEDALTVPPRQKRNVAILKTYSRARVVRKKLDKKRLCNPDVCIHCIYHDGGYQKSDISCGYISYHPSHKRRPCPAGECTVIETYEERARGWKAERIT